MYIDTDTDTAYTADMSKLIEKFIRKGFWITNKNKKDIEVEAKKQKVSESALMRCIINSWFEK